MDLHPDLEPLAFLIGSWAGVGRGEYPTIESFRYAEQVEFSPGPGKPFLAYVQRTQTTDGEPLHSEAGFLRMTGSGPELVIAQPTGLAEAHSGTLDGQILALQSLAVASTPEAKDVREVQRQLRVVGGVLHYRLELAYAEVPLTLHLEAELRRSPAEL